MAIQTIFNEIPTSLWKQFSSSQKDYSVIVTTRGKFLEIFRQFCYESYLLNLRQISQNLCQLEWTNR